MIEAIVIARAGVEKVSHVYNDRLHRSHSGSTQRPFEATSVLDQLQEEFVGECLWNNCWRRDSGHSQPDRGLREPVKIEAHHVALKSVVSTSFG